MKRVRYAALGVLVVAGCGGARPQPLQKPVRQTPHARPDVGALVAQAKARCYWLEQTVAWALQDLAFASAERTAQRMLASRCVRGGYALQYVRAWRAWFGFGRGNAHYDRSLLELYRCGPLDLTTSAPERCARVVRQGCLAATPPATAGASVPTATRGISVPINPTLWNAAMACVTRFLGPQLSQNLNSERARRLARYARWFITAKSKAESNRGCPQLHLPQAPPMRSRAGFDRRLALLESMVRSIDDIICADELITQARELRQSLVFVPLTQQTARLSRLQALARVESIMDARLSRLLEPGIDHQLHTLAAQTEHANLLTERTAAIRLEGTAATLRRGNSAAAALRGLLRKYSKALGRDRHKYRQRCPRQLRAWQRAARRLEQLRP